MDRRCVGCRHPYWRTLPTNIQPFAGQEAKRPEIDETAVKVEEERNKWVLETLSRERSDRERERSDRRRETSRLHDLLEHMREDLRRVNDARGERR